MANALEWLYRVLYRAPARWLYRSFVMRPLRERLDAIEAAAQQTARDECTQVRASVERLGREVASDTRRLTQRIDGLAPDLEPSAPASDYHAVVGPDQAAFRRQVEENYRDLSNPFGYYEDLIGGLAEIERARLLPLGEFASMEPNGSERLIGLRHDIDADPETAVRAARHLAGRGIRGSFYLLHTAGYYGHFDNGLFVRNPEVARWVEWLAASGCEIGLHNDALGAQLHHGVDGAAAVVGELEWLRSHGAEVTGTVGHNSAPAYGAENSEVFRGRRLWSREARSPEGKALPLETLDEGRLGLAYEGTFARPRTDPDVEAANAFSVDRASASVRSEAWMRRYLLDNPCCEWGVDAQFWLIGRDEWVIGGRADGDVFFDFKAGLGQVLERVRALPEASRAVFVIHPVFVRG